MYTLEMLAKASVEWQKRKEEKELSKLPTGPESLDKILAEVKDILQ